MIENPARLIKELRGAPLSVLLLLQVAGQAVSQAWLERWSGYTDKPVSQALAYLEECGLAAKCRQGWRLGSGAIQLPLGTSLLEEESGEEDSEIVGKIPTSRNNSDSAYTTTTLINLDSSEKVVVVLSNAESRKNSDLQSENSGDFEENDPEISTQFDPDGFSVDATRQALETCGISEPMRSRLAGLEGMNAAYVFGLAQALKRAKGDRYGPGLLVHAIKGEQMVEDGDRRQGQREWANLNGWHYNVYGELERV